MDPQQPQQPQQPSVPPQPPVQGPEPSYTQPQYQPQPTSAPQPEYQQQPTPPIAPSAATPVQQPYQAQPYEPQPAPGQFGPAGAVPPQPGFPPQAQPQNGVFGSGPAAPYTPGPSKGKGKLFTLIGIIVAGLIVLGVGIWALMTFVFASIPLETYKGDGYSILVPKDYKKEETGSTITYTSEKQKGKNDEDVYSAMYLSSTDIPTGTTKDQFLELYDKYFDEDTFKQSFMASKSDDGEIKNFKSEKMKYQGFDARKYTADVYKGSTKVGSVYSLTVFTDKKVYTVGILAHSQVEAGFRASADKILNSLKIDE